MRLGRRNDVATVATPSPLAGEGGVRGNHRSTLPAVGMKRAPSPLYCPRRRLLRSSPQETLRCRPGMRFAHSASPQRHPCAARVRCGHEIVKHTDLSLGRSRLALRLAGMTRPRRGRLAAAARRNAREAADKMEDLSLGIPPKARRRTRRHPGQAKREPGS